MGLDKQNNYTKLITLLTELREEEAITEVKRLLETGIAPLDIVEACQTGMRYVGENYENGHYFISGLIMGGEILRQVLVMLQPFLEKRSEVSGFGTILLGTIQGDIHDLGDLARSGLKLGLADRAVPVGQYSLRFLENASQPESFGSAYKGEVLGNVVSYEENVRAVLSKVYLGEVDAGITYASDYTSAGAMGAGTLGSLDIPVELNVLTSYYVAPLREGAQGDLTARFLEYLLSIEGQAILATHGLIPTNSSQVGAGR